LDQKFKNVARELKRWSNAQVGSVRLQLVLARETLGELDELMETRQLDQAELELRRSLKIRVLGLASLSRCMARQRARVLFLREGDANTKFFHLQACHRSRRQRIECLDVQGLQIVGEAEKAEACYQHFMGILGTNFQRSRRFDLNVLGLPVEDLQEVERLFTEQEVWAAIQELPGDRAPGPDGFSGLFYKKCWHIIKDDIMHAFNAFWALDYRSFHHLNEAFMILLRKKEQPSEISDYRPISLIHSFEKLLSKCLTLRLAPWLQRLVQPNQSAFIRGRSIHDNFRTVRLNCVAIHKARLPCVLLKVDIAKAFDSVDWSFLLEILQHMGFPRRWRDWLAGILSTASTKILLNGVTGQRICHARGLRQGDPLSPLLFVLVMEVLNRCFGWAHLNGLLSPILALEGHRVSLYADDLVVFISPTVGDLSVVKTILHVFGLASGLFTNLDKSRASPLNCEQEDLERVQQVLACGVADFPVRYLGIPLSVFRLKWADEQPLIDKVAARIPAWKGGLLNVAGRTALAKATLSAIPVHTAIAIVLSPWAVKSIDRLRRAFIWAGSSSVSGGKCKVAWDVVCMPKELGGLGIADLRRVGIALRARWVWFDRVSGRVPSSSDKTALALANAAMKIVLGNGAAVLFWSDRWLNGRSVGDIAPSVLAAVRPRKLRATVPEALPQGAWLQHLYGAVTVQIFVEVADLYDQLEQVQLHDTPDTFTWSLSPDHAYSSASAYGAMFLGSSIPLGAKKIWRSPAPPKVHLFFWLVLHGRCWTADRRFRHGLQDSSTCVLCDQECETIDHILVGCVFSREVWLRCSLWAHLQGSAFDPTSSAIETWLHTRKLFAKERRKGFDAFFFLVGWCLWKERNRRTFDARSTQAVRLLSLIQEEAGH